MTRRAMLGRWEPLYPAVYRLPGAPRTMRQRAMAAVLWAGSESAISHTSAASQLRFDPVLGDGLHITVPAGSGVRASALIVHRMRPFARGDVVVVDGIRCTSATRTLLDCAALLDDEALEHAFEHARRMGL